MTETASLNENIKKQTEFYFSDHNLPRDKFLKAKIAESPEGWVSLEVMTSFRKLGDLTKDIKVIAEALANSTILELSEDKTKIRRLTPVPTEQDVNNRTLVVTNIPKDSNVEAISTFFTQFGPVGAVRCVTEPQTEVFSGKAFIVFEEQAGLDSAIAKGDDMPKFGDNKIECNKFKTIKKKEKPEVPDRNAELRAQIEEERKNHAPGCILRFTFPADTNTENLRPLELKDYFGHFGEIRRVEFQEGEKVGTARFASAEGCSRAKKELDEKKDSHKIQGVVPDITILEGEEEQREWDSIAEKRLSHVNQSSARGGRGGRGRGRGGRGRGGRGRGGRGGSRDRQNRIESVVDDD
ncbi:putative Lupus La protein like protein [Blattamonas nauphoetae]|uniref:Lupus La protein like protein n=1 Tax=Blattamonas nauphoetae TaxID=2049346 RepID=A0ABQ9YGH2_9EUKA|nr:putative Lupus La protein like protein [Blattamonas nauphoetae]